MSDTYTHDQLYGRSVIEALLINDRKEIAKERLEGLKKTLKSDLQDFVKYEKKSKAAGSFRAAFKSNCSGGAKSFTCDGRSYSCAKAGPKKAKKPISRGGETRQDPA